MRTDPEPTPRLDNPVRAKRLATPAPWVALPRAIRNPHVDFLDVLQERRSAAGGEVAIEDLSSLLWHSTLLRERQAGGRFGLPWESRPAPSAGGLHATRLIVLPLGEAATAGEYLPDPHALAAINPAGLDTNRASVHDMLRVHSGVTIQFAFDVGLLEGCYMNAETLMWRDAGALATTICLVATALGLTSVILGRTGDAILAAAGMDAQLRGTGAVHIGTPQANEGAQ